jgi:hypothetical protein
MCFFLQVKKRRVTNVSKFGNVTLREFDKPDVAGAILVEGFPAVSLTSIIVANYFGQRNS